MVNALALRDTPDWMTTIQRPAFQVPGSPVAVAPGATDTLDVSLDTTIHTITVLLAKVTGSVTVSATGDQTGYEYLAAQTTTADAIFRIAVAAQFDTSVTVTVQAAAGATCTAYVGVASDPLSLDIANTVTTTGEVQITNTVTVQGSVQATFPSAQQVEFTSAQPVTATFQSAQPVTATFQTAQPVIVNDTAPVNIQNAVLNMNPLVASAIKDLGTVTLAAGAATGDNLIPVNEGIYDEIFIVLHSTTGSISGIDVSVSQFRNQGDNGAAWAQPTQGTLSSPYSRDSNNYGIFGPFSTAEPFVFNQVDVILHNTNNVQVSGDFGIIVYCKYASVSNAQGNPVQSQTQYQNNQTTGNWNFGSTTLAVGQRTGPAFITGWLSGTNLKRVQVLMNQTASSGLGNNAQLTVSLYASPDANTSYYVGDIAQNTVNGAYKYAFDSNLYPQIAGGYPYVALAVELFNNGSASSTSSSAGSATTQYQY